jgi:hypothetical protein
MNHREVLLSLLLSASALIIVFSIPSESFAQRQLCDKTVNMW